MMLVLLFNLISIATIVSSEACDTYPRCDDRGFTGPVPVLQRGDVISTDYLNLSHNRISEVSDSVQS